MGPKHHRMLLGILILSLMRIALADDEAVLKYKNYTPEQISKIPEKERSSDVPMMYTMAARTGLSVGSDVLFAMQLNSLMYPGLHDYVDAVKELQTDLGDSPSGVLTVWQIYQLGQRAEMQKLATVGFPDQFSSYISKSYASVQGTVKIIDEVIAWPINHVRIECLREDGVCTVHQISLTTPHEESWSQTYSVIENSAETYEISHWGAESIDTVPLGTSKSCRTTSLSFNFKTKEFFFITRNAGGDCKLPLGGELDKLTKPRIAQIVDGGEIHRAKFTELQQRAYAVLSTAFKTRVDALGSNAGGKK